MIGDFDGFIISHNLNGPAGATQTIYKFPNSYGASVIRGGTMAYGGFEMAVLKSGSICYDTPITDDVIGYLDDKKLSELLTEIQKLPGVLESGVKK